MKTSLKTKWFLYLLIVPILMTAQLALADSESIVYLPLVLRDAAAVPIPIATPGSTSTPTTTSTATPTASATLNPTATASPAQTPTVPPGTGITVVLPTPSSTHTPAPADTATPAATATSTATSTPTETGTATATATATPTNTPNVSISSNDTWFIDSIDNLHIVGQVENHGTSNVQFAKITANVFNAANQIIAVDFTYTKLDVIPPSQRACYHIIVDNPVNWTYYELEGTYLVGGVYAPSLVAPTVSTGYDAFGVPEMLGQIRNDGSGKAKFVKAVGTLFNAGGQVIGCDSAYVSSTDLNPGQTSSFRIGFWPHTYPPIDSFLLQAHGDPE